MVAGVAGVDARLPVAVAHNRAAAIALHRPMVARHVRALARKPATRMVAQ
jgi:hypothetical protein